MTLLSTKAKVIVGGSVLKTSIDLEAVTVLPLPPVTVHRTVCVPTLKLLVLVGEQLTTPPLVEYPIVK